MSKLQLCQNCPALQLLKYDTSLICHDSQPLCLQYVLRAAGLYNRLLKAGTSYRELLALHTADARRPEATSQQFWLHGLWDVLEVLEPGRAGHWSRTFNQAHPIDTKVVGQLLQAAYVEHLESYRGLREGEGSRIGYYLREVAEHGPGQVPTYLTLGLPSSTTRACMRFRLGCHFLRVHTGRWSHSVARAERVCQRCPAAHRQLDDEVHCLFSCWHRSIRQARARLCAKVFGGHVPASISHMFQSQASHRSNLAQVVRFVAHCYEVTAACFRAGGTDDPHLVHKHVGHPLLALLPPGELDLFEDDLQYMDNFEDSD